jgi:hypothetical protein
MGKISGAGLSLICFGSDPDSYFTEENKSIRGNKGMLGTDQADFDFKPPHCIDDLVNFGN